MELKQIQFAGSEMVREWVVTIRMLYDLVHLEDVETWLSTSCEMVDFVDKPQDVFCI